MEKSVDSDLKECESLLNDFFEELKVCTEFAEAAIQGAKRQNLPKYRLDRLMGVLEEEIILVVFLAEMLSSVKYLLNRIQTDTSLDQFDVQISKNRKAKNLKSGFVENVLQSLQKLKDSGSNEFRQIYELVKDRYSVGNKLFSIICDLQKFNTPHAVP